MKGYDYGVTPARVDVVDFNYLPKGLTGNEGTRRGLAIRLLVETLGREPVTRMKARGILRSSVRVFILEFLKETLGGEHENESNQLSMV